MSHLDTRNPAARQPRIFQDRLVPIRKPRNTKKLNTDSRLYPTLIELFLTPTPHFEGCHRRFNFPHNPEALLTTSATSSTPSV